MQSKIAVVGSINMDLVVQANTFPKPGETVLGRDFQMIPGGKGANQAVAAARLGSQVSMVGRVGADTFGNTLRDNLLRDGIHCAFVRQDLDHASGVALIVVNKDGQNSIVVAPGANMAMSLKDIDNASRVVTSADVVLLQLEIPLDVVVAVAKMARANGTKVILNPAPARELPDELYSLVDILVPNQGEAEVLTGLPVDNFDTAEEAARDLTKRGVGTVIITMGEKGAYALQNGKAIIVPAYKVDVVDTTAAGDAFMGGLGVAIAEGLGLADALRWANACGALAVTRLGAQPSLPARQQVERLVAEGEIL